MFLEVGSPCFGEDKYDPEDLKAKEVVFLRREALAGLGDMSVHHRSKNRSSSLPRYVVPQPGSHIPPEAKASTHTPGLSHVLAQDCWTDAYGNVLLHFLSF